MNRIIVSKDLCIGCQICFKSFFIDVIKWDAVNIKPVIKYPEECVQCGFCEMNCPKRAIKMEPDYESYMFPRENIFTME